MPKFPIFDEDAFIREAARAEQAKDKPVVTAVSIHPVETATDIEPAHVAQVLGRADDAIRTLYGVVCNKEGPIFPSDLTELLRTKTGMIARDAFKQVLEHSFEPTPAPQYYKRVFNAPQIMLINEAIEKMPPHGKMLVAEARESDIRRIIRAVRDRPAKGVHIYIQTSAQPKGHVNWPYWMHPCLQTLDEILRRPEYEHEFDAAFFPYSFARAVGTRDRAAFMCSMRFVLKRNGIIYATYLDHEAVRQQSNKLGTAMNSSVTIYAESPENGVEGSFLTRIGRDRTYEDYVVTQEAIAKFVIPGEELEIKPARVYLDSVRVPDFLRAASEHDHVSMVRILKWRMGDVMHQVPISDVEGHDFLPAGFTTASVYDFETIYNVNRGVAFSDVDLFYHHPAQTIVTPKADGVEAVVWTEDDTTVYMAKRGDPNVYKANWHLPPKLIVQVELVGSEVLRPKWVVVTDVTRWPGGEVGYAARMSGLASYLGARSPLTFPPQMAGCFHPNLRGLDPPYPYDGYVLNNRSSLPGMFKSGRGAARYLKHFYTKEVRGEDGYIYEVPLHGVHRGYPKLRIDRDKPSTAREIDVLSAAWTVSDYEARIHYLCHAPVSLESTIRRAPRAEAPHFEFNIAEKLYLWVPWRNRAIETMVYNLHGAEAVEWMQQDLANAISKMARENLEKKAAESAESDESPGSRTRADVALPISSPVFHALGI